MKKSTAYHKAQIAVLRDTTIDYENTLEILKVLMASEDLEKFVENELEKSDEAV